MTTTRRCLNWPFAHARAGDLGRLYAVDAKQQTAAGESLPLSPSYHISQPPWAFRKLATTSPSTSTSSPRSAHSLSLPDDLTSITNLLDRIPFSPPAAILIALSSFLRARSILGPSLTFTEHVRARHHLSIFLAFVAIKTANRALTRLVRNNGWKRDRPVWSKVKGKGDVVLITGGSTGIGKEMVEILAKKTDKIVVLDMAMPTYRASE
jgi:hypothetical protein